MTRRLKSGGGFTMSHFRSLLAVGALVIGGAVVASAQQTQPPVGQRQQVSGQHVKGERGFGARRGQNPSLRGIALSETEKANVANVHAKYSSQMKALREQSKPQMDAARAARQRGDTAAVRELWEKGSAQREQSKQLMLAEQNDLRGALSPDNQTRFDANVATMKSRLAARAAKGKRVHRLPS
jgi:Spy/CpxP family protein refolding chaperone